jgi:DNA-binding transcriptional LysR family regulator
MELRHLRYFVAVAEELNFSRAAERLHIAQPPLSQQIQSLENELGVRLFDRGERPIRLTESGLVLLEQASPLLARLDEIVATVRRIGKGQTGAIRIGFVGSATYDFLPELFRRFRLEYEDVELSLVELRAMPQIESLRHREIDIGFMRTSVEDESFQCQALLEEPLVVALPENHPLAAQDSIRLSALKGEPFIGFSAAMTVFGGYLLKVCQEAGFVPNVVQETIEIQTAVSLVSAGVGLTLAPASLQKVGRIGVVYRSLAAPVPKTTLYAVWRKDNRTPVVRAFLALLQEVLSSLAKD